MSAGATPRIEIERRLTRLSAAIERSWFHTARGLFRILGQELALKPNRVRLSVRVGLETALGMGLMSAMHIESILGAYVLYNLAAGGAPMLRPATALVLILAEGFALALSHPLAGILVEAPWLMLGFFAGLTAAYTYMVRRLQLGAAWLMVQITFLGTFYIVVFAPSDYGWEVSSTFGGVTVAFLMMVIFDTVLWPEPAERTLLESLRAHLARTRARFKDVVSVFLAPNPDRAASPAPLISSLPVHLNLLSRAAAEGADAYREAVLLAFVTVHERIYIEVARLAYVANERAPRIVRAMFKPQLEAIANALDRSMEALDGYLGAGIPGEVPSPLADPSKDVEAALAALDRRRDEVAILTRPEAQAAELNVLGGFMHGLRQIARLLERAPNDTPIPVKERPPQSIGSKLLPLDAETAKYATKVGVAIALAYVVGLTTRRGDLTVILWTIIIAGLPTYGATFRKMILRLAGGILGGIIGLAAIIVVTPNFNTVLSYMVASFVALTLCAYAGQASDRVNYAARQAGTSFVLIFAGLSPNDNVYTPLWRVWGMLLGIAIVALVFLVLWPEYATNSLTPRLRKLLRACIELMPGGAAALSDDAIQRTERDLMNTASEVLKIADDARLEGRVSAIDPDQVVDAAGTLRRIAFRAGSIAAGRLQTSMPQLKPAPRAARDAYEAELRTRIQIWLDFITDNPTPSSRGALELFGRRDSARLPALLKRYSDIISADSYAEVAGWPADARVVLFAEIESYQRFVVLADELDDNLARVPLPSARWTR